MVVPHSFFLDVLAEDKVNLKKYQRWLSKSFTDDNASVKWCPKAGCEYAVSKVEGIEYSLTVECICGHNYCFKCSKELHRPADCKMVAEWDLKNNSESENVRWIIANTK